MTSKLRVLVVDDDDAVRGLIAHWLDNAGYEVAEASNGHGALLHQAANPVDILVTDLIMPEKEGVETILEFRKLYPRTKILAVSGGGFHYSASNYLSLAQSMGAQQTLAKPFLREELLQAVRNLQA